MNQFHPVLASLGEGAMMFMGIRICRIEPYRKVISRFPWKGEYIIQMYASVHRGFIVDLLADPGKARGCSAIIVVIN